MTLPDPITDPEEALEKGYFGYELDPTPNSEYALGGGGKTPETDDTAKQAAKDRRGEVEKAMFGGEASAAPAAKTTAAKSTASS
jgi:hypothetical protein